jgi:hypothetical protein
MIKINAASLFGVTKRERRLTARYIRKPHHVFVSAAITVTRIPHIIGMII